MNQRMTKPPLSGLTSLLLLLTDTASSFSSYMYISSMSSCNFYTSFSSFNMSSYFFLKLRLYRIVFTHRVGIRPSNGSGVLPWSCILQAKFQVFIRVRLLFNCFVEILLLSFLMIEYWMIYSIRTIIIFVFFPFLVANNQYTKSLLSWFFDTNISIIFSESTLLLFTLRDKQTLLQGSI